MNKRYVLLPYMSYIVENKEKIELTSFRVERNEEKKKFDIALLSHKKVVIAFSIKDMTIQVQQLPKPKNTHKFVISNNKKPRAEFFINHGLQKEDIEKLIKSMII